MSQIADFLKPTSEVELHEVYTIDISQVGPNLCTVNNQKKKLERQILENTPDGKKLIYHVALYAAVDEPIFDPDLERWLCDNKRLLGRPNDRGKVAVRLKFYLRSQFQKGGLATYLCWKEENYFRSWGAREIQVWAMEMGRWVWTRSKFGYQIDDFQFRSAQEKYKEWQRWQGISPVNLASRLSDFPKDFLLNEVHCLALFKIL